MELVTEHNEAHAFLRLSLQDLRQSNVRRVLLVFGGILLAWLLNLGMAHPESAVLVMPLVALLCLVMFLAVLMLPRWFLLSQICVQLGLAGFVMAAASSLHEPLLLVLLALLPLVAAATAGGGLVVGSELLVIAAFLWPGVMPAAAAGGASIREVTILGGVLAGWTGWTAAWTMLGETRWGLVQFVEARQKLSDYQEQRLAFVQAQEDLLLANRELARLYDRLKIMTQAAEDARRVKEEFVANVSHELRTPLNMIIGFSEVILKSPKIYGVRLPDTLLADIRAIQRNSEHLTGLVNDVLTLSQVESDKLVLAREWVSLHDLLLESRNTVRVLFESKGLYLEAELPEEPLTVFCDRLRMREVILNLLSNAGRFTEHGGVVMRAWQEDHKAIVAVADTGPGIPAQDQQRIFEPFQQLGARATRMREGSGLGLSISKRYVELHDGKMWLESEVGRGTTFYISLPFEPVAEASIQTGITRWINPYQQRDTRTRGSAAPSLSVAPRFVVFEDADQMQKLFRQFVPQAEVVSVRTVADLMEQSRRSPATAVVINTANPQDAIDQIRTASGFPYGTPTIVCWVPGEREAARDLGVLRYLVKPVSQATLLAAVAEVKQEVKSVLVVDDDPEAVQLFSRMLSTEDGSLRVMRAMNGNQALAVMRHRQPDVVLLDLVMPEMDGFAVLREKEKDATIRQIPVLVVSSLDPPHGGAISDLFSVSRSGGLSAQELFGCIQAVSGILSPTDWHNAPGQPADLPA